jgi:transcriptional regulatory protein GAL4
MADYPPSHFLFHASFVPLIALHTDLASPDRPKWGEAVDLALEVLRTLKEEPLAQRCLQVVELLDPRRPFDGGELNDVYPWADLLQMDLLGDPSGGMGGPAETL